MATQAEKDRLIEGLAFISTHRPLWDQGAWMERDGCGTHACLAGHIAITLNPSKLIVAVPTKALQKPAAERTEREQRQVDDMERFQQLVRWVEADGVGQREKISLHGKTIYGIHVSHRASRLIGNLDRGEDSSFRSSHDDFTHLWAARHNLSTLVKSAAISLDMTQAELKRQMKQVAEKNGWGKQEATA